MAGLEARLRLRAGAGQVACPSPSGSPLGSLGPPDAAALAKAWVGRQVEFLSIPAPRKPLATPSNVPFPTERTPNPILQHLSYSPLRPRSPLQTLVRWLRQVELSFMMGPGSDDVRRLLLTLRETSSPGRDGAAAATMESEAVAVGWIYLSEIELLGRLHVREEWLREQLA